MSNNDNSEIFTIRTTPTLTIYPADEDNDMESNFTDRLERIISGSNSDLMVNAQQPPKEDLFDDEHNPAVEDAKQFWILSDAGKLIYAMSSSDKDNEDDDDNKYIGYVGVIQTVISSFKLDGSDLKSLIAGKTRLVIMNQSPIILVAISKLNETEQGLLAQLDLLYSFLLSTLSKPQIIRSFQNKHGFDLRKHLGRADLSGLDSLCQSLMNFDIGVLVGALQSIRLRKTIRAKLNSVLLGNKNKDTLYGLVVAPGGKLISIMRPKRHTLHTTDLQVLFFLVFNQLNDKKKQSNLDENEELWMPICLSKFNSNGFLYSFVKFIGSFALILIGADKNSFFEMRETAQKIVQELKTKDLLKPLQEAIKRPLATTEVQVDPMVYHFIFKSKKNLQYIVPELQNENNVKNLQEYYIELQSSIDRTSKISVSYMEWANSTDSEDLDSDSGPGTTRSYSVYNTSSSSIHSRSMSIMSLNAMVNNNNNNNGKPDDTQSKNSIAGLAWCTPNYELLVLSSGGVKKDDLVSSARTIVNWCRKYEERLFVHNGATF